MTLDFYDCREGTISIEDLLLISITFAMPDDNREELARKVAVVVQGAMNIAGKDVKVSIFPYTPNDDKSEPAETVPEPVRERDTDKEGF